MTDYTSEFYRKQAGGSLQSARAIAPVLMELVKPRSVVDVGCGVGPWLLAFSELGIEDFWGIDGDYVDRQALLIPPDRFAATDLSRPFTAPRTYDLALSLEVAEHLPETSAAVFVESLTRLAPAVYFSAAIPGQGGTSHQNEQWPDYWSELFARRGYAAADCIRRRFWHDPGVEFWYSQNGILYVDRSRMRPGQLTQKDIDWGAPPPRLVHPQLFIIVRATAERRRLCHLPRRAAGYVKRKLGLVS